MGQYWRAIILGADGIYMWVDPTAFGEGAKMIEHCYVSSKCVQTVVRQISSDGLGPSRVVWAGDYADKEDAEDAEPRDDAASATPAADAENLYTMAEAKEPYFPQFLYTRHFTYIVNHTKQQFVTVGRTDRYHPLPILTAEGNGRGGGDWKGDGPVGSWARDVISAETERPDMEEIWMSEKGSGATWSSE
jgi:hypothetical protein